MTIDLKNNLFSASLLFRSLRNGQTHTSNLWEESIVLIYALDIDDAFEKASNIGHAKKGYSYTANNGDELTWEFFNVLNVFQINEDLQDGVELFSRHLRGTEVESLLTPFED